MEENLASNHALEGVTNADFVLDDGGGNRLPTMQKMAIRALKKMNFQEDQNITKAKLLEEIKLNKRIHESQQQSIVNLQMKYEALDAHYQNKKRNWRQKFLNFGRAVQKNVLVLNSRGQRARAELREHALHCAHIHQRQEQLAAAAASIHNKMADDELARPREMLQLRDMILTEQRNLEQLREVLASHEECAKISVTLAGDKALAFERDLAIVTNTLEEAGKARALLQQEDEELAGSLAQVGDHLKLWKDKYSNDMAELNSKLFEQKQTASELDGEICSLKRAVRNQSDFNETLIEQNSQVQEKISSLRCAGGQAAAKREELLREMENTDAGIANATSRLAERTQQLQETEMRIRDMETDVTTNMKTLQTLAQELQQMGLKNEEQRKTFDEERAKIVEEIEAYSATEKSLKETEIELADVKDQIEQIKRDATVKLSVHEETASKLTGEIEQKDAELAKTVEIIDVLKSELNGARAVRADLLASKEGYNKESKAIQAELVAVQLQLSLAEVDDDRAESAELSQALNAAKKKAAELNKKEAAKTSTIAEHDETVASTKASLQDQIYQAIKKKEAGEAALTALEAELASHTREEEKRDKLRKENASRTSALAEEVAALERQLQAARDTIDTLELDTQRAVGERDELTRESARRAEDVKTLEKKISVIQQEQRKLAEAREIERREKEARSDISKSQKRSAEVANSQKRSVEVANSQKRPTGVANSQKRSAEVANSQKRSAEVADSQKRPTEVANSQKRSAEVANSQKGSAEVANSQKRSAEVANSQKLSAEVANSQKRSAEVANSQKRSAEVANSQKRSAEVANSQKRSAEVANSQKRSAKVPNSQKGSTEVANLQKRSAEVANFQKQSMEIANSQKRSAEVASSQKRSTEVANSQNRSAEVANSQKRSAEVANSQKRSAEVANSQKRSAEVANSQERSAEVANSQKGSAEVAKPVEEEAAEGAAPLGALKWPQLHRRPPGAAASKRVQFRETPPEVTVFDRIDMGDSGDEKPWRHVSKKQKHDLGERTSFRAYAQSAREAALLRRRQDAAMPAPPPPPHRSPSEAAREASERPRFLSSRPPRRRPYVPSLEELRASVALAQPNPEKEPTRDKTAAEIIGL